MITMPGLRPGRYLTLQEQYEEWRASEDGQRVYATIAAMALGLRDRGFRHYGLKALYEAARYSHQLKVGPDADGFKMNNNWTSRVARDLVAEYRELDGFFEFRELRA